MDFRPILPAPVRRNEASDEVGGQASFVWNFTRRFVENRTGATVPATGLRHVSMRRGRGRPVDNYCMKVVVLQAGYLKRPNSWKELQQLKEAGLGSLDYGKLRVSPNLDEEGFRQLLITVCPVLRGHNFSLCKANFGGDLIPLTGINTPSEMKKAVKRGTLYIVPHSVVQTYQPSLYGGMETCDDTTSGSCPEPAKKSQCEISIKQEPGDSLTRFSAEDITSVNNPLRQCGNVGNICDDVTKGGGSASFAEQERGEGMVNSQVTGCPVPSNIFLPTKFDLECEDFNSLSVGHAKLVTRKEDPSSVCIEAQEENDSVEGVSINKNGLLLTESKGVHKRSVCEATFNHKDQLSACSISHMRAKPFQCRKCDKSFRSKAVFKHHTRIHAGARPYKCDVCSFAFRQKAHLVAHSRLHASEKPYICTECDQSFCFQRTLVAHMQVHSCEKPYKCTVCVKTFTVEQDLMTHVTAHTRNTPFECRECGSAFRSKSNLKIHMRTHSGVKLYKCKTCGWAFHRKSYLMAHSQRHASEKPYKCSECDRDFRHKQALVNHKQRHAQPLLGSHSEANETIDHIRLHPTLNKCIS